MTVLELSLMGIGLAMDAFAVSVCKGLTMRKVNKLHCFIIALFFGGFQAIMPLIGWFLGNQFADRIRFIDHWVAFILLSYIGGKMIIDGIRDKAEGEVTDIEQMDPPLNIKELFLMAIATSIDALAVGITFSFLEVNIIEAVSIIGIITFLISVIGVFAGNICGSKYQSKAEIVGGGILILIGLKIFIEHLS